MAYRTRSARRFARKSRSKFFATFIISGLLIYVTIFWLLPFLINGLGTIQNAINPPKKGENISENPTLAPPVLNIPFEATNSAQIDVSGFATPETKIRIYVDDELKDDVTSAKDGSFTVRNINLGLGTNNIFGKTVDEKDKESLPSKTIRIVYDNEIPYLEVIEPEDGKNIQGERKLRVSGKTESGSRVFVNDTQAIVSSDGSFSVLFNLNDGENILTIKVRDLATNFIEITRRVTFQP